MAVYKVPQDVEADDKFLGPLSFKQFIFMGGALIFAYVTFLLATKGIWILVIFTLLPTIIFGFLAFPWSGEQPTELWLAARIHFFLKPRRRIWDQSGIKNLVTVTVPKKTSAHALTDGLDQGQVQSRMSALASVIDSRGWATKNYNPATSASPFAQPLQADDSDRLVEGNVKTTNEFDSIVATTTDVMDEENGVIAKQFESMIQQSAQQHKQERTQLVDSVRSTASNKHEKPKTQEDFWFMHQNKQATQDPNFTTFQAGPVVQPGSDNNTPFPGSSVTHATDFSQDAPIDENAVLEKVHNKQAQDKLQTTSMHEKMLLPLSEQKKNNQQQAKDQKKQPKTGMTPPKDPVILDLAKSNDLNVATLSREANRDLPNDEVIVSLH